MFRKIAFAAVALTLIANVETQAFAKGGKGGAKAGAKAGHPAAHNHNHPGNKGGHVGHRFNHRGGWGFAAYDAPIYAVDVQPEVAVVDPVVDTQVVDTPVVTSDSYATSWGFEHGHRGGHRGHQGHGGHTNHGGHGGHAGHGGHGKK